MRADRLLILLMLLQSKGRMTAAELAQRLEVSERTIYRDIDALSWAGVPIVGDRGPSGGYSLLESYRTNLTGLTEGQVRALFMLNVPQALADLGMSRDLEAALLKLSAAMPTTTQAGEEQVRQRFHIDSTWWTRPEGQLTHLEVIQNAVWQDRRLEIRYRPLFAADIEIVVEPYGLVSKAGIWYLVYARGEKHEAQKISDLIAVHLMEETFDRPKPFDLALWWEEWCAEHESQRGVFAAVVRIAPSFQPYLARYFGIAVQEQAAADKDADGWARLELAFESFETARERLLGLGGAVEVLTPLALRRSMVDMAEQIVKLYRSERSLLQ